MLFSRGISHDDVQAILEVAHGLTARPPFLAMRSGYFVLGGAKIPGLSKAFLRQLRVADSVDEALSMAPTSDNGEVQVVSLGFTSLKRAASFAAKVEILLEGRVAAFQNVDTVDVVPAGCSKGAGLAVVRERLGLGLVGGIGDSFTTSRLLKRPTLAIPSTALPRMSGQVPRCWWMMSPVPLRTLSGDRLLRVWRESTVGIRFLLGVPPKNRIPTVNLCQDASRNAQGGAKEQRRGQRPWPSPPPRLT